MPIIQEITMVVYLSHVSVRPLASNVFEVIWAVSQPQRS